MRRPASQHQNETQQNDCNNDDDFETAQPEFEFAEELDAKVVDADDDDQENGDEDAGVYSVGIDPVLDYEGGGGELVWCLYRQLI